MTQIQGIIIRSYPSRESDLVLKVITKETGKLSLLAKYARKSRKKHGSSYDILDKGRFETREGKGSLLLVESFIPEGGYRKIREDLNKITAASVVLECTDILIHEESGPGEDPYEILDLALKAIDDAKDLKEILKSCFLGVGHLLNMAGFGTDEIYGVPSAKRLLGLLSTVEESGERKLESKTALIGLLENLRAKAAISE